jgi:hypothetical protein
MDHIETLKLATCAQEEYWMNVDESLSIVGDLTGSGSGNTRMDFSNGRQQRLAPRAKSFLSTAGLLYKGSVKLNESASVSI